jgi:hypothetical protein
LLAGNAERKAEKDPTAAIELIKAYTESTKKEILIDKLKNDPTELVNFLEELKVNPMIASEKYFFTTSMAIAFVELVEFPILFFVGILSNGVFYLDKIVFIFLSVLSLAKLTSRLFSSILLFIITPLSQINKKSKLKSSFMTAIAGFFLLVTSIFGTYLAFLIYKNLHFGKFF